MDRGLPELRPGRMAMPTPTIIDLMDRALRAERLGRFDEARELLRRAVALGETPETTNARLRRGNLLIQGGPSHHTEAETVLIEARRRAEQQGAPRQAATA